MYISLGFGLGASPKRQEGFLMPGPAAMLLLICLSLLFPLAACAGEDPALLEDSQVAEEPTSIPTLLSEDAASSILRDFLIDCIASWDVVYESSSLPSPYGRKFERGGPVPTGEAREWWEALARQPVSSRYAGITDKTDVRNREEHLETWVVIGPGLNPRGGRPSGDPRNLASLCRAANR